jgi:hypothetical protein
MTNTTKTVSGYFGDKQVTKEEFVKQWHTQFVQFLHLANTGKELDELDMMMHRIDELAAAKWDAIK